MQTPDYLGRKLDLTAAIWAEISNVKIPADRWLGNYFHQHRKKFGSKDRRFYAEIIYSLFRHKTFLRLWAEQAEVPEHDVPHAMVLLAAHLEGLLPPNYAEDAAESQGWKFQASHFADLKETRLPPAYRRFENEDSAEAFSMRFSFPVWLVEKWIAYYGPARCRELLETCQKRPPFTIRVNPVKITRLELKKKLMTAGHKATETKRSPYGLVFEERANLFDSAEFKDGFFEVQDEGSHLLCIEMAPKPGEWLWDVCAGGGGKTLLLGALMENKGRIVATDIRSSKLDELAKRAKRAGLFNVFPADLKRMGELKRAQKGFDRILVDAPCSGTGTLRRNPDAKWKLTEDCFLRFQKEQLEILKNALPYLKKGGRIYYATCSLEPEENEQVMEAFLGENPALTAVPAGRPLGEPRHGHGEKAGGEKPFMRLFPPQDQTDGFFLAVAENNKDI